MEIIRIRLRLEQLPEEIEKAEEGYITSKATLEYRIDLKKHLLAFCKENEVGSNPERESKALASDNYKTHLDLIYQSAIDTGKLGARFHKLKNELDAMRSLNKNID